VFGIFIQKALNSRLLKTFSLPYFSKYKTQWLFLLFWVMMGIYAYVSQILLVSNISLIVLLIAPLGLMTQTKTSYRYLPIVVLFAILGMTLQVRTFFYFAWVYTGILWIEVFLGKTSKLWLILPFIASPLFDYLFSVWSFPLKIAISEVTAIAFNNLGINTLAEGNVVVFKGKHFTVDDACMGLKLFSVAYLFGWLLLAIVEKKLQKELSWKFLIAIFLAVFFLNIFANFVRILLLVFFQIPPENALHEWVGIISVIVYIILPITIFIKWHFKNQIIENHNVRYVFSEVFSSKYLVLGISYGFLLVMPYFLTKQPDILTRESKQILQTSLQKKILPNDIIQYHDDKILIYQKFLKNFYSIEHSPLICWKGSGYMFQQVKKRKINDIEIWAGILKKDQHQLYTVWWMDNGEKQSIHLWNWRWDWFKNQKPYYLLNITANTEKELNEFLEKWLKK
jgi:exosortase N